MNSETRKSERSEKVSNQLEIVKEAREHTFEFGFRYPLLHDRSAISLYGDQWTIRTQPANVDDDVWYGNCIDDALLTAQYVKARIEDENTHVHIQFLDADTTSALPDSMNHYRTVVEIPGSREIFHEIDHSPFFSEYFFSAETGIHTWTDLDESEIADLQQDRVPTMNKLFLRAYEEKEIGSITSITYLSINQLHTGKISITFDVLMPSLVESPIIHSETILDLNSQSMDQEDISFYKGGSYQTTDAKTPYAAPKEIVEILQEYSKEVSEMVLNSVQKSA